ncbi:MAG: hypothetical protein M3151_03935 [Actinomycetota bacterium]|nr:hypothetical protein [Actinomycetota bacterium]
MSACAIGSGIADNADLNLVDRVNFTGGERTDCNGTHVAGILTAKDTGCSED